MKSPTILASIVALAAITGCTSTPVPNAPAVGHVDTQPATPPEPNWFSRTGDATWNAVQQPVRWMTPKRSADQTPASADTQPLYEPADAIIVPREGGKLIVPQDSTMPTNSGATVALPAASQPKRD